MSIFIKAGLWINKKIGYKGEFNLTQFVTDLISSTPPVLPYKVYTALISQTGTSAPIITAILENTLEITLTFEYTSAGIYTVTASTAAFTTDKTVLNIMQVILSNGISNTCGDLTNNSFTLGSCDKNSVSNVDNLLLNTPLEIRVYN